VLVLARSLSDPAFLKRAALKAVSASSQLSSRFLVRLWCSALPTYRLLSKRIAEDSESHTAVMYTPNGSDCPVIDDDGTCPLCEQEPETLEHVLLRCTHSVIAHHRAVAESAAERELAAVSSAVPDSLSGGSAQCWVTGSQCGRGGEWYRGR
jgi:hypothetical protein